jgi:hypothetical protein
MANRHASDRIETSLGPATERHGAVWALDLETLPLYRGLSVLSRALADMVIAQARERRVDIDVERSVRPRENPELVADLGVRQVKVAAEHATVAGIARDPVLFEKQLRTLFGTLQRAAYRETLLPAEPGRESRALVFQFDRADGRPGEGLRFVLEQIHAGADPSERHLRVTVEDPAGRRLDLRSLPHVRVEGIDRRRFIAGSTRIAQTWRERLARATAAGRRTIVDERAPHSHVFQQLDGAGLVRIVRIEVAWSERFVSEILGSEPGVVERLLKKVLLALEDVTVHELLAGGDTLRLDLGDASVYLDTTQLGRVLHIGIDQPCERRVADDFLTVMPSLSGVVEVALADGDTRPLHDTSIFLIHHLTADIVGLIAALRRLGCRDLRVLFVDYAGEAPTDYLAPLLDLPSGEFSATALVRVPDEGNVEGRYVLSTRFSERADRAALEAALTRGRPRFYEAMRRVAKLEMWTLCQSARERGRRWLVIEDGGYLAPALNQACLEAQTVQSFLKDESPQCDDLRLLADRLGPGLIGSVEHTRNGHDRLARVQEAHGRLAYPAFSIAVSHRKRVDEASEVAVSVLAALESVMHACGRTLTRRRCLVLGSRGAIGRHLVRALSHRLAGGQAALSGVDLAACDTPDAGTGAIVECSHLRELPRATWLDRDLVIGVTGVSVLEGTDLESWILEGTQPELWLASGSTKTEEFEGLSAWVDHLLAQSEPHLGGAPLRILDAEVRDPLSGRLFGHRYAFELDRGDALRRRSVVFVANSMPINFLFYGVPTEPIDEVLAQLLTTSLGLVSRAQGAPPDTRLHAVDVDIDEHGGELERGAE